jgi:predicted small secreted protein
MKRRLALYAGLGLAALLLSSCGAVNSANGYATRIAQALGRTVSQ